MSSSTQHTALPGFTLIAPTIWERQPTGSWSQTFSSDEPPSLIIVLPWTGAHGRHVEKYTEAYNVLFPSTPILCITTTTKDICLRSSARKQQRLLPAVKRIQQHMMHKGGGGHPAPKILLHAFSEGGSNKAAELADAYHRATGTILPCAALCLDSTPGHPRFLRLCNALRKSLPPIPILNVTGLFFGSAVLGCIWVLSKCIQGPNNDVISRTRRRLQDAERWDGGAPRCYLYSRADELIAWKDVREHLGEAVRAGVPVMDVCFEGSAHCRHAAKDAERYWGAIALTWRRGCEHEREVKGKEDSKGGLRGGYGGAVVVSETAGAVVGVRVGLL